MPDVPAPAVPVFTLGNVPEVPEMTFSRSFTFDTPPVVMLLPVVVVVVGVVAGKRGAFANAAASKEDANCCPAATNACGVAPCRSRFNNTADLAATSAFGEFANCPAALIMALMLGLPDASCEAIVTAP